MIQEKTFSHFWLYRLLPEKVVGYFELIRFEKPIGFLLLMWPCWFGLAYSNKSYNDLFYLYILFFLGSFLMRSAGCIINDIIDINIDKDVERTAQRPLVSKKVFGKNKLKWWLDTG